MLLGIGPVLRSEMVTTARRPRYYLARVVYGLILLYFLWNQEANWVWFHTVNREILWAQGVTMGRTHEEIRRFAESWFIAFIGVQGFLLLCLVPALLAGVIADEYQRKTLHYLLASRLSSAEIVLGKLGARLLHVGSFVALGLPVVCLLGLYGGLNPDHVFYGYLGTATTVLFAAGLSMLISIMANRPRDAILTTYGVLAIWLWGPWSISRVAHAIRGPLFWVGTVNDWLLDSNPIVVYDQLERGQLVVWRFAGFFRGRFLSDFYKMVELQAGLGLLFLFLAIAGLRPLRARKWPAGRPHAGWGKWLSHLVQLVGRSNLAAPILQNRLLVPRTERPACGDRPIWWKERSARPSGGLKWLSSPLFLIVCGVALGCYFFDVTQPVVAEIVRGPSAGWQRAELNLAVRQSSVVLSILAMITVAASASVSVTSEREADTWVCLATTHLTPAEIVVGKQIGAVWTARRIGIALLAVWLLGVFLSGLGAASFLAAAALTIFSAWFIAALGVYISSRARNGTRAVMGTFAGMIATGWIWPNVLWQALLSPHELAAIRSQLIASHALAGVAFETVIHVGGVAALYAAGAVVLTWCSIRQLHAHWGGF
jgi:ABC-type transport system involved in multi-copper enzyme maturation permease subunit